MTTKRPVKLIKNEERKQSDIKAVEPEADSNKWSKEVRSWVVETKQNREVESLQAFDSLFKDETPEEEDADLMSVSVLLEAKSRETRKPRKPS